MERHSIKHLLSQREDIAPGGEWSRISCYALPPDSTTSQWHVALSLKCCELVTRTMCLGNHVSGNQSRRDVSEGLAACLNKDEQWSRHGWPKTDHSEAYALMSGKPLEWHPYAKLLFSLSLSLSLSLSIYPSPSSSSTYHYWFLWFFAVPLCPLRSLLSLSLSLAATMRGYPLWSKPVNQTLSFSLSLSLSFHVWSPSRPLLQRLLRVY